VRPGALGRRLDEVIRRPIYVGMADGDPVKVTAIRSMRWYDVIELYISRLEQYRRSMSR
jgi:hypothetical protein